MKPNTVSIYFIFIVIYIFRKRTLFNYIQDEKQFTFCNMKHDMKHQNLLLYLCSFWTKKLHNNVTWTIAHCFFSCYVQQHILFPLKCFQCRLRLRKQIEYDVRLHRISLLVYDTLRLYHRWNIYLFLGSFLWLTTVECRLLYILIHYMIYYAAFIWRDKWPRNKHDGHFN